MTFTKQDLKAAFDELEKAPLRVSRVFMSKGDYDDVLAHAGMCMHPDHAGYRKPRAECPHPDCVVQHVLES